jgi:hypothetical protein
MQAESLLTKDQIISCRRYTRLNFWTNSHRDSISL